MCFVLVHSSPVREMRQNTEVVVFKPRTVTAKDLDSLTLITTYTSSSRPTCLSRFYGLFYFPPPSYCPPHKKPFVFVSHLSM